MIILLAAVFIRQAALRLWDLAHGNLGRTCLIQVGYSCQATCVKQNIHCIALHYLIPALFDVYVYMCVCQLHYIYLYLPHIFFICLKLCAIHACHNYENVWKSIRCKTQMRFTSNLGAIQTLNEYPLLSGTRSRDQTDRFGQGWNSLLTHSVACSSFWLREASNFEPEAGTVTCISVGKNVRNGDGGSWYRRHIMGCASTTTPTSDWATADLLRMNCWVSIPNCSHSLTSKEKIQIRLDSIDLHLVYRLRCSLSNTKRLLWFSMIILLAAVFIRQAALRLWDLAHGNLGRTCLIQVGYSCQTTFVKQHIHCIALHYLIPALFDVYFAFAIYITFTIHCVILLNLCAIHACRNYENVWKNIRFKTHMCFKSRSYTKNQWVSPSLRHKMPSGRDFGAIGCDQTDRFGQGWNSLLTYSVARLLFGFGKHRTLSLKLEPSRAFQWAKTPGTGMEEVGIGSTSRDAPQPRPQLLLERLLICWEWTAGSASKTAHIA